MNERNLMGELETNLNELEELLNGTDGLRTNLNMPMNGNYDVDVLNRINELLPSVSGKLIDINDILENKDFVVALSMDDLNNINEKISKVDGFVRNLRTVNNAIKNTAVDGTPTFDNNTIIAMERNARDIVGRVQSVYNTKGTEIDNYQDELEPLVKEFNYNNDELKANVQEAMLCLYLSGQNADVSNNAALPSLNSNTDVNPDYIVHLTQEAFNKFDSDVQYSQYRQEAMKDETKRKNYNSRYILLSEIINRRITRANQLKADITPLRDKIDARVAGGFIEGYADTFDVRRNVARPVVDKNARIREIRDDLLDKFTHAVDGTKTFRDIVVKDQTRLNEFVRILNGLNKDSYFAKRVAEAKTLKDNDNESKELFDEINNIEQARKQTVEAVKDVIAYKKERINRLTENIRERNVQIKAKEQEYNRELKNVLVYQYVLGYMPKDQFITELKNNKLYDKNESFDDLRKEVEKDDIKKDEYKNKLNVSETSLNTIRGELDNLNNSNKVYIEGRDNLINGTLNANLESYISKNDYRLIGMTALDELNKNTKKRYESFNKNEPGIGHFADELNAPKEEKPKEEPKAEEPKEEPKAEEPKEEPKAEEPKKDEAKEVKLPSGLEVDEEPDLNPRKEVTNEKRIKPKKKGKISASLLKFAKVAGIAAAAALVTFAVLGGGIALIGAMPLQVAAAGFVGYKAHDMLKGKSK